MYLSEIFRVQPIKLQLIFKTKQSITRWVGIKESGRPKPALLDYGRPRTGLLLSGIVYTIEGIGTNGTLMPNLDQSLITNRLYVRICSVSRFRVCYLHRYVVLLLSIRLPKSKGIASVYFRFAYIAVDFNIDRFHDRNMCL